MWAVKLFKNKIFPSNGSLDTEIVAHLYHKLLTESTDATSDTMIMIRDVLKWKIGTPHCKG